MFRARDVEPKGDRSVLSLTPERLLARLREKPGARDGHAEVIENLTERDKAMFHRQVGGRPPHGSVGKHGTDMGLPLAVMGPIVVKAPPGCPVRLTALDLGEFANGRHEILVRAGPSGTARVDFRLGVMPGPYRILVKVPGYESEEIRYWCVRGRGGS